MAHGIARWLREIKIEPPKDVAERPHVVQHLFKVNPPMEWTEHVVYRNGRLIKDPRRGLPNRSRVMSKRMEAARIAGEHYSFAKIEKPRYTYSYRTHRTAFVVASASDLKTYMNAAHARMVASGRDRLNYYEALDKDDSTRAEGIAQAKETIRLFSSRLSEFEVETYLFPADKFGNWKNGGELPGSQRGTLDHRVPFNDVGYIVVGMPRELTLVPLILRAAPFEEGKPRIRTTIKEK